MEDTEVYSSPGISMVTVILLGKRGCDKALIGKTMAGYECFKPEISKCKMVAYHMDSHMCGIVSTPDLYHGPKLNSEDEELPQTMLSYAGNRVFLLILQQDNISPEEITMFEKLKETYGETIVDNVIVVLDVSKSKALPAEEDKNIQRIFDECGGRVCYFNRGMKMDELNDQLLSTYKGMLQKNAPARLGSASVEPCDKRSENKMSQPQPAGEKTGAAVSSVQDSLARCSQKVKRQPKQTGEEAGVDVPPVKMVDNNIYKSTDGSQLKQHAALPEEKQVQEAPYEIMNQSNHKPSSNKSEEKKAQLNPNEEKAGAAADSRPYETIGDTKEKAGAAVSEVDSRPYETIGDLMPENKMSTSMAISDNKPLENEHSEVPEKQADRLTIVLLGQTGSGKSATGNTILGSTQFKSHASSTAVTQQCEAADGSMCGIKVRVIDTPDFFDVDLKEPETHVQKCREFSQIQPVVYLLVMHMGRFTDGEREAVSNIQKAFGERVVERTVVLFTGREKLREMSLHDYIKNADLQLQQLVRTLGSRYCAFNNNDKKHNQAKDLVKILLKMPIGESFKSQYNRHKAEQKECIVL